MSGNAQRGEDEFRDCTSCRLIGKSRCAFRRSKRLLSGWTGSAAFIGTGIYSFTIKEEQMTPSYASKSRLFQALMRFRGRVPTAMGTAFIAAGLYRLVN